MSQKWLRECPDHGAKMESRLPGLPVAEGERADVVAVWFCPTSMCRHVIVEARCPECELPLEYAHEPEFGRVLGGDGHGSVVHLPAKLQCPDHGPFDWPFNRAIVRPGWSDD